MGGNNSGVGSFPIPVDEMPPKPVRIIYTEHKRIVSKDKC